jgi:bifunctional UDP-N-acetylglucosamine pyrophosphorylase/glucosamine-1-phosphate N-acetyltransferase
VSKTEKTAIIVLAAGYGTRMKSDLPKVLHSIAGRSLIEHVIHTGCSLSPSQFVTVLGPHTRSIESHIEAYSSIAIQEKALGTGDAVKPALQQLDNFEGNVLILYGDTPLIKTETLQAMLNCLETQHVCVLGFTPEDPGQYGRLITKGNELQQIIEYKEANQQQRDITLCNSGVIAVRKTALDQFIPLITNDNAKGEYYLTDIIGLVTEAGLACGYVETQEDEVLGINNRVELATAERLLQERLRNEAMLAGVTLVDPASTFLSFDTKIGKDVTIEPHVHFSTGVTVGDNSYIKSYSYFEQCNIEANCTIGPFARIRPKTSIESGSKVGNFVEIKNSVLHANAKVGHLTYIGDAEIGEETNIGAGTITCNYDGKNKHKTTVGKRSFIGSNTALVAPITLGDDAFVAAGSTLTKSVASESLAIARSQQKEIKNWNKRRKS